MIYFDKDFINFFKELEKNNNREWFHANKKRYETAVKGPFKEFIAAILKERKKEWGDIPLEAKDFIMRINRDIRFSKDKTPYKVHCAAMMSKHGKKAMDKPGIFIEANHKRIRVYSGLYQIGKEDLYNLRSYIAENPKEFQKLLDDKKFKEVFGEVLGEKNKRIPKEFDVAAQTQPYIYNKGMYYFFEMDSKELLKDKLDVEILKRFKAAKKFNAFFEKVLNIK